MHPTAGSYYRQFPAEPIPPAGSSAYLTVTRVVELPDNRVETLLAAIVREKVAPGGSIIVVSHGTEQGVSLTVGRGRSVTLDARVISVLRANLAEQIDDHEAARRLKFADFNAPQNPTGVQWMKDLKATMEPVRKLGLARVDLRACNTGRRPDTLRQLQFFFNADLCCAPDAYDSFGPVPFANLTSNPTSWNEFRKKHPGAVIVGTGKERFSFAYKVIGDTQISLDAIATSQAAVDVWVRNHLPPFNNYSGGALFFHALTRDKQTLIFAGEPAFRERLVAVTDGKGAVTTNAPLPRDLP